MMVRRDRTEGSKKPVTATQTAFAQYRGQLHRFLVGRLHSSQDAQDLAQDVYLRFLQIAQQEAIREPQALLYRLASNLVYEFRLRQRRGLVTFDSETVDELTAGTSDAWRDEVNQRVSSAQEIDVVLRRLPKVYQTVLLLRKRDGLSPEEIAERMKLSKATISTYLVRAVAQFKNHFEASNTDG